MSRVLTVILVMTVAFLAGFFVITEFLLPQMVGLGDEVAVPVVVGDTTVLAMERLADAQLEPELVLKRSDPRVPAGIVIEQSPRAGSVVKHGRRVALTVSSGARVALVPALRGVSERQAKLDLAAAGLQLGDLILVREAALGEGRVVASEPAAGASVPRGTAVDLLLNEGEPVATYVMPDLSGHPYDLVQRTLSAEGFQVERARYVGGGLGVERVTEQTPLPGARVAEGDRISLSVGG